MQLNTNKVKVEGRNFKNNCEIYPSGDQPEAGLLHEVAGAQDGPQRQRGLVEGGDQRQPGHHQELLGSRHPDTRPSQV